MAMATSPGSSTSWRPVVDWKRRLMQPLYLRLNEDNASGVGSLKPEGGAHTLL